jgi:hypothetical protein
MALSLRAAQEGMTTPDNAFLSADGKEEFATDAVAFYVTALELDQKNQYGERWIVQAETTTGDRRRIGLGSNPRRDAQFFAMVNNLARQPEGGRIGPLVLVSRPIGGGKSVWDLADAPAADAPADDDQSDIDF